MGGGRGWACDSDAVTCIRSHSHMPSISTAMFAPRYSVMQKHTSQTDIPGCFQLLPYSLGVPVRGYDPRTRPPAGLSNSHEVDPGSLDQPRTRLRARQESLGSTLPALRPAAGLARGKPWVWASQGWGREGSAPLGSCHPAKAQHM